MDLYRVVVGWYVAGFVANNGRILRAAPILQWAVGRTVEDVTRWAKNKGGSVEQVTTEPGKEMGG